MYFLLHHIYILLEINKDWNIENIKVKRCNLIIHECDISSPTERLSPTRSYEFEGKISEKKEWKKTKKKKKKGKIGREHISPEFPKGYLYGTLIQKVSAQNSEVSGNRAVFHIKQS